MDSLSVRVLLTSGVFSLAEVNKREVFGVLLGEGPLKHVALAHDCDPVVEGSRLDLHAGKELAEGVEELALHLDVQSLPSALRVSIEQRVEHRLSDYVIELLEKLPPHSLLLLQVHVLQALLLFRLYAHRAMEILGGALAHKILLRVCLKLFFVQYCEGHIVGSDAVEQELLVGLIGYGLSVLIHSALGVRHDDAGGLHTALRLGLFEDFADDVPEAVGDDGVGVFGLEKLLPLHRVVLILESHALLHVFLTQFSHLQILTFTRASTTFEGSLE